MGEVLQFGKRYEEITVQDEDGKEITTLRINTSDAGTAARFRNIIKKIQAREKAFQAQTGALRKKLPENPEIDDMMPVFDLHLQHCKELGQDIDEMGSSPHPRGTHPPHSFFSSKAGIIPASAGNTLPFLSFLQSCKDHPRIRGEHPVSAVKNCPIRGSSPHPRGTHFRSFRDGHRFRIIPASAGNTVILFLRSCGDEDHPRIRGEHVDIRCFPDR